MDFSFPPEADAFRNEVRSFLAETLTDEMLAQTQTDGTMHAPALHAAMAEKGWLAGPVPAELGGGGRSALESVILNEEMQLARAPIDAMAVSIIVAAILLEHGNDHLKETVVPRLLDGTALACFGYSEPEFGSDVASAKTKAERDGDEWRINGAKMWTTMAHIADFVILLTRTDPAVAKHKGLTFFLVPLDTPGIEIQPVPTMATERSNATFYDDVRLDDHWRVGDVNGGWAVMKTALKYERGIAGGQFHSPPVIEAAIDWATGVIMHALKERGLDETTLVIFTSDNGAEGSGAQDPFTFATQRTVASLGYNTDYATLGLKGSYNTINPGFTSAAVSPLSFYKFYVGEGGLRVPLVISGLPLGEVIKQTPAFAWATDIAATVISLAGIESPAGRYGGRPVLPMTGRDLLPVVSGEQPRVYADEDSVGYELTGHGVLFQGDYKLARNLAPLGDGEWRLFDIVSDPGETRDLKDKMPARFQQMLSAYENFERQNRVQALPAGYSQRRQLLLNMLRDRLGGGVIVSLLLVLILIPFVAYVRMRAPRR